MLSPVSEQGSEPVHRPRPRGGRGRAGGRLANIEGWLFVAPIALGIAMFQVIPLGVSLYASLTSWDGISSPEFVGLANYMKLISGDELFRVTLRNTLVFTLGTIPLTTALAFGLALLVNRPLRGIAFFRTAYFAPYVTNVVAVGFVWFWFLHPTDGLVNGALGGLGIDGPEWLSDAKWVLPALILVSVWQGVGYPMVILLAGLQGIPKDIYEAADLDGAGPWQRTRRVTLPLMTPHFFFVLITQFIVSFQLFGLIYVMTKGGPGYSSSVYIYYLWQTAFGYGQIGYASAMAWVVFVLIASVTWIQWRLQKRWVFYG